MTTDWHDMPAGDQALGAAQAAHRAASETAHRLHALAMKVDALDQLVFRQAQRISEMDAYIKALEAGVNARLYDLAVNAFNSGR